MAASDSDTKDLSESRESPVEALDATHDNVSTTSTSNAINLEAANRPSRQSLLRSRITRIRRRKTATILGSIVLLVALVVVVMRVSTGAGVFVEGSSLPFGTIATTSRRRTYAFRMKFGDTDNDANALSSSSSSSRKNVNHRKIFDTRAGSTSAGFVSAASGGLGLEPLSYYLRVALAGGVAGATGSAVLYPIDSAKTLRQSDPGAYSSVKDALVQMLRSKHAIARVYRGILPAALGAIPSSALYFGAYESSKMVLQKLMGEIGGKSEPDYKQRLLTHGLAAASGNVISSFVFVPKEVIKQQLQIKGASTVTIRSIVQKKGLSGLYAGYGATLLRNIPSATIRFVLYEELKRKWATADANGSNANASSNSNSNSPQTVKLRAAGTFLAGAVAGSTSSFVMTPIDVVKTRMATGSCPLGVKSCMLHVIQEVGWKGLYAGAGSRVLWSGAFSAIGFGTFELVKGHLGVATVSSSSESRAKVVAPMVTTTVTTATATPAKTL